MKKYYLTIFYPLMCSILVITIFGAPNGSDWAAYTTFSPVGIKLYREFISWSIIDIFIKYYSISSTYWFVVYYSVVLFLTVKAFKTLGGQHYYILYPLMFSNFYLQFSCNGLRQGIAFLFILFGIAYKSYFLSAIFSVFSHNSALVVLGWLKQTHIMKTNIYLFPACLFFFMYSLGYFSDKYSSTPGNNEFVFASLLFCLALYLAYKRQLINVILCFLVFITYTNSNVFIRLMYYVIPLAYLYAAASVRVSPKLKYLVFYTSVSLSPVFYLHPSIGKIWGY